MGTSDISFCDLAKKNFDFLCTDFGFEFTRESTAKAIEYVEYCNRRVYVRVIRSGPDYEPHIVFGRTNEEGTQQSESFDWVDLKELECCESWKWESQPNQPFCGRVTQLARLLRDCGRKCLDGDDSTYDAMRERREQLLKQHIQEENSNHSRQMARVAWDEKRYEEFIGHLQGVTEALTASEKMKIEYASKMLGT